MSGYCVDHWFLWDNEELRSKTYHYPTYEADLECVDRCSEDEGSTRVALRKIGPKRSSSALKVWEAPSEGREGGCGPHPPFEHPYPR